MTSTTQTVELLEPRLAISRLPADAPVPSWVWSATGFLTITRSPGELSIITDEAVVPPTVPSRRGYRALRVRGTLPFGLIGVLLSLLDPLARAGIPVFALSTHDTDYVLVRDGDLEQARNALERAGHHVLT
jgi:uncharacterized protein